MNPDRAQARRLPRLLAGLTVGIVVVGALAGSASGASDDANRTAARTEAQQLLDETPLPAGAVPQTTAPAPILVHDTQGGPLEQDTTLDRVAWWTVPVSPGDYEDYITAHRPAGLTARGVGGGTETNTAAGTSMSWTEQDFTGTDTDAYTTPELWLTWTVYDGGTAVRAEVYIGARWPRSARSYVTGRIKRVDVRIAGSGRPLAVSYTARGTVGRLRGS